MKRKFVIACSLALGGCVGPPGLSSQTVDLMVRGGMVYDGVSERGRVADVAVSGERIMVLRPKLRLRAKREIDAHGLVVAPGFIDPHTHLEKDLGAADPLVRFVPSQLLQGVTTVVVGNDGDGSPEVAERLALMSRAGTGANVSTFVGFGSVRRRIIGEEARAPSTAEISRMRALVGKAMCEGALGLSTGLFYAPQRFSDTQEVVELAQEAASRSGIYDTHLRDEGAGDIGLMPALEEAIEIGRMAGLPVHVAHIKALGEEARGQSTQVVARILAARAAGLRVTADQYPWHASGTTLVAAFLPGWAQDGGPEALARRIGDLGLRSRLEAEISQAIRKRGGPAAALVTAGRHRGRRLDTIASAWSMTPSAAVLRIIAEDGDAPVASFNMSDDDIRTFRAQPWVVTSSDAVDGHPRKYGSFARAWQLFVRDSALLSPGAFVRRSTGLTAELLGLEGRGKLVPGAFADIVLFDPRLFGATADFEHPRRLATGVHTVIVNGRIAVDRGVSTKRLGGQALAKPRKAEWSCPR